MRNEYMVSTDAIALTAATAKTVLELTNTTVEGRLCEWSVTFDGVTASAVPAKVELLLVSASVGATATTVTPTKWNHSGTAAGIVAKHSASAEGTITTTDASLVYRVPPTGGLTIAYPLGSEYFLPAGANKYFRIRLTAAAGVNATFSARWAE